MNTNQLPYRTCVYLISNRGSFFEMGCYHKLLRELIRGVRALSGRNNLPNNNDWNNDGGIMLRLSSRLTIQSLSVERNRSFFTLSHTWTANPPAPCHACIPEAFFALAKCGCRVRS